MKVAFHFNSAALGVDYGSPAMRSVLSALLSEPYVHVSSRVFAGDVLFWRTGERRRAALLELWLGTGSRVWARLAEGRVTPTVVGEVYAVCFDDINEEAAERLHERLVESDSYLGAVEVDSNFLPHRQMYALQPHFRIVGQAAWVFWEGFDGTHKDLGLASTLQSLGFTEVDWEALYGGVHLFDRD